MVKLDVPKNDLVPLIRRPGLFLVFSLNVLIKLFLSKNNVIHEDVNQD